MICRVCGKETNDDRRACQECIKAWEATTTMTEVLLSRLREYAIDLGDVTGSGECVWVSWKNIQKIMGGRE